jgi:hypothetical protein
MLWRLGTEKSLYLDQQEEQHRNLGTDNKNIKGIICHLVRVGIRTLVNQSKTCCVVDNIIGQSNQHIISYNYVWRHYGRNPLDNNGYHQYQGINKKLKEQQSDQQ